MVPSARVGYETLLVFPPIESIVMTLLIYEVRESLPDDFENLLSDSVEGGHQFLQRPQTEWLSGANRFSKAGERLVIATKQGWLIGVGGINVDPYTGAASWTLREMEVDNGRGRDGRLCVQQASTQFQQGLAVPGPAH